MNLVIFEKKRFLSIRVCKKGPFAEQNPAIRGNLLAGMKNDGLIWRDDGRERWLASKQAITGLVEQQAK